MRIRLNGRYFNVAAEVALRLIAAGKAEAVVDRATTATARPTQFATVNPKER